MTRLIYSKQDNRQGNLRAETVPAAEADQVLHLKRLLATMKHHYENSLQQFQIQMQVEQNQRLAVQKELEKAQTQIDENQKFHEEELEALRLQQTMLKELLKKAHDELQQKKEAPSTPELPNLENSRERVEQLELMIPYLRGQTEDVNLEMEDLQEELNQAQKKVKNLEQELTDSKQLSEIELEKLKQLLEEQKQSIDQGVETVVSTTSSHYLRLELENIKKTISQGSHDAKALEVQYVEVLNEKIGLEHKCKQLQLQIDHQSSNITSFQENLHALEDLNRGLEAAVQSKETELTDSYKCSKELEKKIESIFEINKEKELFQEKYEQLKEEWKQLHDRFEEAVEIRIQTDIHLNQIEAMATRQKVQLQEFSQQAQTLSHEKEELETERNHLKTLLEESESRLKIAQQHLAKKVKEAALLSGKLEEEQLQLAEYSQLAEQQKREIDQLQSSIDHFQKQEKRLQDQLHEALKGWEDKYFRMYDKWQESENRVKELQKFEEKHLQMQNLLSNLGNFMGVASNPHPAFSHPLKDIPERPITKPFSLDSAATVETSATSDGLFETQGEKFDLFGMRQPPEKNPL